MPLQGEGKFRRQRLRGEWSLRTTGIKHYVRKTDTKGQVSDLANSTPTCAASQKGATLKDTTVFAPQQRVKARLLRDQAGFPADHILVCAHGNELDVAFKNEAELDPVEG